MPACERAARRRDNRQRTDSPCEPTSCAGPAGARVRRLRPVNRGVLSPYIRPRQLLLVSVKAGFGDPAALLRRNVDVGW